jgi:hypothetical protein
MSRPVARACRKTGRLKLSILWISTGWLDAREEQ